MIEQLLLSKLNTEACSYNPNGKIKPPAPKLGGNPEETYIGGIFNAEDPLLGRMDKVGIQNFLNNPQSDPVHKQRLMALLPKFSGPVCSHDVDYYVADKNRGYLSPLILEKLGRQQLSKFNGDTSTTSIEHIRMLGLEYWIERGYVVVSKDPYVCKQILQKHGYSFSSETEEQPYLLKAALLYPGKAKKILQKQRLAHIYDDMKQEIGQLGLKIHYETKSHKQLGNKSIPPLELVCMSVPTDPPTSS